MSIGGSALGATPVGSQFQVNTYTTGFQGAPSVAFDADGNFVVVWSGPGIQAQRYDASGTALGTEFQINTMTGGWDPSVAATGDGDFVVVWSSYESPGDDTSLESVQGQRYDASGSAVGSQFQVNTYTTSKQRWPSVAVDEGGGFVVVWTSYGSAGSDSSSYSVQGQRYDASGNAAGTEFQVNTYTHLKQQDPSVAFSADGGFVVVWQSNGNASGAHYAIQGQLYDASGTPLGTEFQVNTLGGCWNPSMAGNADGNFVVAWTSTGHDDYGYRDIASQRFDANGNAVGSEFRVNTVTEQNQEEPSVGLDADGDFIIVWRSGTRVRGQEFDASGNAVGSEFQVNTYSTNANWNAAVAVDADGDFVVVWQSYRTSSGNDTDDWSIQGQRYAVPGPLIPSLSPPGAICLGLLLFGIAAAGLRGRLRERA